MKITKITKSYTANLLGIVIIFAAGYLLNAMQHVYRYRAVGNSLVEQTAGFADFEPSGPDRVLVLGDSLAYGVGTSSPSQSMAGIIAARFPNCGVINKSVVGNDAEDLAGSIDSLLTDRYSAILIVIGGNDIIRFKNDLSVSVSHLDTIYETAGAASDKVILVTTPDFRNVSFVPFGLKGYFSDRSRVVRDHASDYASRTESTTYIDVFDVDPETYKNYEAQDGFHLNDAGTAALMQGVIKAMKAK